MVRAAGRARAAPRPTAARALVSSSNWLIGPDSFAKALVNTVRVPRSIPMSALREDVSRDEEGRWQPAPCGSGRRRARPRDGPSRRTTPRTLGAVVADLEAEHGPALAKVLAHCSFLVDGVRAGPDFALPRAPRSRCCRPSPAADPATSGRGGRQRAVTPSRQPGERHMSPTRRRRGPRSPPGDPGPVVVTRCVHDRCGRCSVAAGLAVVLGIAAAGPEGVLVAASPCSSLASVRWFAALDVYAGARGAPSSAPPPPSGLISRSRCVTIVTRCRPSPLSWAGDARRHAAAARRRDGRDRLTTP